MSEILTKNGELRKRPPKKYECKSCGHHTSKPKTVKLNHVSFYVCDQCGGSLNLRQEYIIWYKRKTGQWDVEKKIIKTIAREVKVSKKELEKYFESKNKFLFDAALNDLVFNEVLNVEQHEDDLIYTLANFEMDSEIKEKF